MNSRSTAANSTAFTPLERWARFGEVIGSDGVKSIGTEDVVAALLDRSLLQNELDTGSALPVEELVRVDRADRRYRSAAATLLDQTDVALFKDNEASTHWWWHIEELVLGRASEMLLDVPHAAQLKGVHPHTIRLAIKNGLLPARRLARGFLVHRRDLERWRPRRVGRPKGSSRTPADSLLDGFNEANCRGEFVRARDIAQAIELEPTTPRRKLAVALSKFNEADYDAAIHWARLALDGELPGHSKQTALLVEGRALLANGMARNARSVLLRAEGLGHVDALVSAALADACLGLNRPSRAVELAKKATEQAPDVVAFKLVLARMEWHADDVGACLEHVMEFRVREPEHEEAALLFAAAMGILGDRTGDRAFHERALGAIEQWRTSSPDAAQAHGVALARLGRTSQAIRELRAMCSKGSTDVPWLRSARHVGHAIVETGWPDVERLRSLERRVTSLVGDDEYLRRARAFALAADGAVDEVLETLGVSLGEAAGSQLSDAQIVLLALVQAQRLTETGAFVERILGETAEPTALHQAIGAALAVGDVETAKRGLKAMELQEDLAGQMATIALRLLDVGVRHGRQQALLALAISDDMSDGAAITHPGSNPSNVPARESSWEGSHAWTTPVVDDLIRLGGVVTASSN